MSDEIQGEDANLSEPQTTEQQIAGDVTNPQEEEITSPVSFVPNESSPQEPTPAAEPVDPVTQAAVNAMAKGEILQGVPVAPAGERVIWSNLPELAYKTFWDAMVSGNPHLAGSNYPKFPELPLPTQVSWESVVDTMRDYIE